MSDHHDDVPVKDVSEAHRTKSLIMDKDRILRREDQQDRILQLTDENVFLKKHSRKFEQKAKQLEVKLNRILSEKKFEGRKDEIEAEESRQRIIDLEHQVGMLKDKLQVAKQQLVSYTRLFPVHAHKQIKSSRPSKAPTSNGSTTAGVAPELSEQFEILLLEIKAENQALMSQVSLLRNQVQSLERELETSKELIKIKEITHEDEVKILRGQLTHPDDEKKKLADSIQVIRLQRDARRATSWLSTLETQCKALESNLTNCQETSQQLEAQLTATQEELQEIQQQNLNLQKQVEDNLAQSCRTKELEAQVLSLQEENAILKETNNGLQEKIKAAGEKTRKVESEESTLKFQISQMETTLKNEIQSRTELYSEVSREKTKCQTLTETLTDLQQKFSAMETEMKKLHKATASTPLITFFEPGINNNNFPVISQSSESQVYDDDSAVVVKPAHFPAKVESTNSSLANNNNVEQSGQEIADKNAANYDSGVTKTEEQAAKPMIENGNSKTTIISCDYCQTLEKDLATTRNTMNQLRDDLFKTKSLLKTQMTTNRECHREIDNLSVKLEKADKFHHEKLQEFMKLLEERADQMQNLEKSLQLIQPPSKTFSTGDMAVGLQEGVASPLDKPEQTLPTTPQPSESPSVEIFIEKLIPVASQQNLVFENLFATWEYDDDGTKYSPVVQNGNFCSGSTHALDAKNFHDKIQVQIHKTMGAADCQTVGRGVLRPDKTTCIIMSITFPEEPVGELQYKFIVKGADMKNILPVRVEMPPQKPQISPTKPRSPSPKKETHSDPPQQKPQTKSPHASPVKVSGQEVSHSSPPIKALPMPKPRKPRDTTAATVAPSLQKKKRQSSPSSSVSDNSSDEFGGPVSPSKSTKSQEKPNKSNNGRNEVLQTLEEEASKVMDKPPPCTSSKTPILRKNSASPESKRPHKKVTITEIVEERRIPPGEDKSESSEGTYEVQKPFLGNVVGTIPGDESGLDLVKKLAAEAGFQVPVIQVQSSGPKDGVTKEKPSSSVKATKHQKGHDSSTTDQSLEEDLQAETSSTNAPKLSSGEDDVTATTTTTTTSTIQKLKRSQRKGKPRSKRSAGESPSASLDSQESSTTNSSQESESSTTYSQSIRVEISYLIFNSPCRIWTDPKVKRIFVEYRFLDFNPEELETPNSATKPQPGKKAEFNFVKVFPIDTRERRRLLQGLLREKKRLRFTVVSEPGENDTLDCEDIGYAYVPFEILAKEDLAQEMVKIYDAENPRLELGSLCLSIQARRVLKSL